MTEFDLHRAVLDDPIESLDIANGAGLLLICWGYRKNVAGKAPVAERIVAATAEPALDGKE